MHLVAFQYGRSASHFHKSRKKSTYYSLLISTLTNSRDVTLLYISALDRLYGKDLPSWNINPLKVEKGNRKGLFVGQMNTVQMIWNKNNTSWTHDHGGGWILTQNDVWVFFLTSKILVVCSDPFVSVGCVPWENNIRKTP